MKKLLLLAVVALQSLIVSSTASAAMCPVGNIADYVALGSTGCSIGEFVFTNFTLQQGAADDESARAGVDFAPQLLPGASGFSGISVTPLMQGNTIVGVTFGLSPAFAGNGRLYNAAIGYQVSGVVLTGATLALGGATADGGSARTDAAYCLGGVFLRPGGAACNGNGIASLGVTDASPEARLAFSTAYSTLQVFNDIVLDSGSGSATLSSVSDRFIVSPRAVPEPESVLLLAIGLLGLGLVRRRAAVRRAR